MVSLRLRVVYERKIGIFFKIKKIPDFDPDVPLLGGGEITVFVLAIGRVYSGQYNLLLTFHETGLIFHMYGIGIACFQPVRISEVMEKCHFMSTGAIPVVVPLSSWWVWVKDIAITCSNCGSLDMEKIMSAASFLDDGPNRRPGSTCCGREERCSTPPCSTGGVCRRD